MNKFLLTAFAILFCLQVDAQKLTPTDYEQAVSFARDNYYNKTAFNLYTTVKWFEDNKSMYFIDYNTEGKSYKKVTFSDLKTSLLFDHNRLAGLLREHVDQEINSNALDLSNIELIMKNRF